MPVLRPPLVHEVRGVSLNCANSAGGSLVAQLRAHALRLAAFVGAMWLAFFLSAALPVLHLNRHAGCRACLAGGMAS